MDKKSMLIYFDYAEILDDFTDAELGELFRAVFSFCVHGEIKPKEQFSDRAVSQCYKRMVNDQKLNIERYNKKCETNRRNAYFQNHPNDTEEDYQRWRKEKFSERKRSQANAADIDIENDIDIGFDIGFDIGSEKVKEKDARENHQGKHLSNGETEEELPFS